MAMNESIFSELFAYSEQEKEKIKKKGKKRFLFYEIKELLSKTKVMHGIMGIRGTGKTVILIQLANELENSIYVSSEQLLIRSVSLYEFTSYARQKNFKNIFLDEIHLYPNWTFELKALYDEGNIRIIFSGSSALALIEQGADLSRRAIMHSLPPLSFREFILLKYNAELPKVKIEEIIDFEKRKSLIRDITPYFTRIEEYMNSGALAFSLDEENPQHLYEQIISKIVRSDLASLKKIDINHIETIYKMLGFIATSNPDKINYNSISSALRKNIYVVMEIIRLLRDIGIIMAVLPKGRGAKEARKEYKLLLLPPFRSVISRLLYSQVIKGGIREDFFILHTNPEKARYIKTDRERRTSDYEVNGHVFEIGGENKERKESEYVVVDSLPLDEKRIPLSLFGLLY